MKKIVTLTAAAAFALAAGFAGPANAIDLSAGLVGHWSFDDETNPTNDDSGNGNDATLAFDSSEGGAGTDPAFDTGNIPPILGNVASIDFDGEEDYVVVGDDDVLTPTGDAVTIAVWINPDTSDAGIRMICGKWNDDSREYQLQHVDGNVEFIISHDGTFVSALNATSDAVTNGVWTHVAGVYDGAAMKVFLNGVQSGSTFATTTGFTNTLARLTIGAQNFPGTLNGWNRFFDGHLDDCRVYDRALTEQEIAVLVNSFPGTVEKELVSGPNDDAGAPIVVDVNPFDAGGIEVSRPTAQHFEIKITITNDGEDDAINGLKVFDVFGAEFDPDPDAEDASIPEDLCTVGEGGDGTCDGIQVVSETGSCTAEINPHDSDRKLDPHFVTIVLIDLDEGETCMVTVWVETSQNPASAKGKKDPQWEPTSCDLVMAEDLFNTFTLNEGLKVFDPDSGIRLLGPVGSLQLTCNFPD